MRLTEDQRETINNSIWVVNTILKKQGLSSNEDIRQEAILYMARCIQRYDPNRNVKWTTYAYRNIYLFIKRLREKERLHRRVIVNEPVDGLLNNLQDFSLDNSEDIIVSQFKAACDDNELQIIELLEKGYSRIEIAKRLCMTRMQVTKSILSVRTKISLRGEIW